MRLYIFCAVVLFGLPGNGCHAEATANQLSRAEAISGWELLFDGQTADQFRNYGQQQVSSGWQVDDGAITRVAKGAGDIITKQEFRYFELSIEYNIAHGGNSGIMFHVEEGAGPPWFTGPEVQVLCNAAGHDPQRAGWLYQLYSPRKENGLHLDATRPAGQWNQIYLRISPTGCEVCMNGVRYYTFNLGDQNWDKRVAESKFAKMKKFGKTGKGHICLQDHGDRVAYRNIKIRRLTEDGSLPKPPVDGKLDIQPVVAFPELQWEGYQPVDEDGNVTKQLRLIELTYARGIPKRLFAAAQNGIVYTFENQPNVAKASIVLDLSDKVSRWSSSPMANEQGLLGIAMHPDFKSNGRFFVSYNLGQDDKTVISSFQISASDPLKADPDSEVVLLELPQPYKNHNGGAIEFGPDGYLYIGLGDGGLRNDPHSHGQDLSTLLGTILRIDVDHPRNGQNYSIPVDNPFVGNSSAKPEIYAYGLRNPWRIAFDRQTGRLWCGDVGQELWEEINVIEKGGNYGWSYREGTKPFGNAVQPADFAPIEPVWEYDHGVGKSITGGRVFSSDRLPQLTGKYLYADYVSGGIWALTYDQLAGQATRNEQIASGGIPVLAFGEDESGEVYYCTDNGQARCIFKFEAK
ncbi:MAG: PQQ-dependent sugar dehydrogenase [Pirellulaceae bacterium]|nr:PQQ-dependent sugar dehydrogenase [Pirellulaceae bacterium]